MVDANVARENGSWLVDVRGRIGSSSTAATARASGRAHWPIRRAPARARDQAGEHGGCAASSQTATESRRLRTVVDLREALGSDTARPLPRRRAAGADRGHEGARPRHRRGRARAHAVLRPVRSSWRGSTPGRSVQVGRPGRAATWRHPRTPLLRSRHRTRRSAEPEVRD